MDVGGGYGHRCAVLVGGQAAVGEADRAGAAQGDAVESGQLAAHEVDGRGDGALDQYGVRRYGERAVADDGGPPRAGGALGEAEGLRDASAQLGAVRVDGEGAGPVEGGAGDDPDVLQGEVGDLGVGGEP